MGADFTNGMYVPKIGDASITYKLKHQSQRATQSLTLELDHK